MSSSTPNRLTIIWSSADRGVAETMVFMYATNARLEGWWDDVTVLIWGPSARLAARDPKIQKRMARMKDAGVNLMACKRCADDYGVALALEEQGVQVFHAGTYLTEIIKSGEKLITF
jgi:hypothetical protein